MVLKTILVLSYSLLVGAWTCQASITIANWTFETTAPSTAGPFSPEQGVGSALGWHASSDAVYSNPVGNGSGESFSANTWVVGDYWQFQVSTEGYLGLTLSWGQTSSETGPTDFRLEYSSDGTAFSSFGPSYTVGTASWGSSTGSSSSVHTADLSSVMDLNDASSIYLRLVAISAPRGTSGTSRVDDFVISAVAVPEPSTIVAGALLLLPLGVGTIRVLRNRKRS
ncbi:hypothetical protein GC207_02320 [bacterium]|nr:hypothetical protein [bacterium]